MSEREKFITDAVLRFFSANNWAITPEAIAGYANEQYQCNISANTVAVYMQGMYAGLTHRETK